MRRKIKSLYSSGVQVGYGVGLLLSTGLVSLISMMTTDEQFLSWGWRIPFLFSIVLVLGALWVRNGMEESAEFEQQQHNQAAAKKRIPVIEALLRHPGAFLKIIALRLCELLTMYIVTAFALNYSTQNMGLPRELFLNIGLLVGGLSCLTIPVLLACRSLWSPQGLYHRCVNRNVERISFLYGA